MYRFSGFDGLRGWLAWAVVACHIAFFTGLIQRFPQLRVLQRIGDEAVCIFIILSGFVITHLIIEKAEPYYDYLRRRFLRIFPIYALALSVGVVATYLNFDTFLSLPSAMAFPMPEIARLTAQRHALDGAGFWENLLLHFSMLHGAISSKWIFESQYAFLRPAWSLSLEWQFYLVAPLIIWTARRRNYSIALAVGAVSMYYAYLRGHLGTFVLPSFLPGAVLYFAIGIITCLFIHRSKVNGSPFALLILVGAYLHWPPQSHWPLALWTVFFGASILKDRPGRLGAALSSAYNPVFASRVARHLGLPSYSTYLLHLPILQVLQYFAVRQLQLDTIDANCLAIMGTLSLTYLASQATFRWIELPFIELGRRKGPMAVAGETNRLSVR